MSDQIEPTAGDGTPLFDFIRESLATELGIKRVEAANDPDPIDAAEAAAIATLARLPWYVSSDTILPDIGVFGFTDNRAMGPIMRRLVKAGHITPSGEYRNSLRAGNHGNPVAVYRNILRYPRECDQPVSNP